MKKLIFLLASAGMLLTACIAEDSGMQEQIGEAVIIGATYEAPEAEPGTRSIIENGGTFKWSEYDSFNAFSTGTSYGNFEDNVFQFYKFDKEDRTSATFIGYGISGRIKDVAVCPATLQPTWNGEILTVTYPQEITWVKGEADPYMVARGFEVGAKKLSFKNLGGIIKLTINEIPVTASKVAVTIWGGRITGEFTVEETTVSDVTYWVVNDDVTSSETSSTVTFTFTASDVDAEGMTFYVPVPVMEYSKIGFSVLNSNNEPLFSFASSEKTRTVARKQIVSFPSITFVAGGGEGNFSNVITTDSGQTGTVTLPSTTNDVYVLMNSTAGEITLVPGEENPKEVYITILKDATVNSLNVNLPNSTVFINGEANSNLGTLNSTTSANTLRVQKSPLTIGTATINQGNANIEGTVNSIVVASGATSDGQSAGATNQVQIFVSKDAALQTVTLNAKTDVVVEQPKDQIDVDATENKVYVIVNAEGSTATAQNGGDIYVTANANCAVTAGGGQSEDPSKESTATIDKTGTGTVTTTEKTQGDIVEDVEGPDKAQIGDVKYKTLAAALAAANEGDTITLLLDICETSTMYSGDTQFNHWINKSITIEGDNHTITVAGRGIGVQGVSSDIDVTFKNVTVTNVGSANGRCVDTRGKISSLSFINSTLTTAQSSTTEYLQPLTIGGNQSNTATVTITNSNITVVENAKKGYAITTFNPVNMTITGSTIKGWACLNFKGASNSAGSYGSVTNVTGCTLISANGTPGDSNSYCAIKIEDDDVNVNVTNTVINVNGGDNIQSIVSFQKNPDPITYSSNCNVSLNEGNNVTLEGDYRFAYIPAGCSFTITGGTFNVDPSDYVAPGYAATQSGNVWTVAPISGVAAIGTQGYETLTAAFAAVQNNETITMLADVNLTDRIFVNAGATPTFDSGNRYATSTESKTITLDLNGHNITSTSNFAQAGGTFNITNTGTANNTHGVISTTTAGLAPVEVRGTGDLNAKRTLNVGTGVTLTGTTYGLNVFGSNTADLNKIEVNVNGTVNGTIFVLGNLKNTANVININVNGKVYVAAIEDDKRNVGVALNGYASVNVASTANVEGETGIEVRAGQLTVANGATIKANASSFSYAFNGSGSTTTGAAIAVVQHTTELPISATINGGTLTGVKKLYVKDEMGNNLENVAVSAVEAIKNEAEIPAGFVWQANGNMFDLVPDYVAQIGETKYITLAEAISAANATGNVTINLLKDYDFEANEPGYGYTTDWVAKDETTPRNNMLDFSGNNITFDLGNHTISNMFNNTFKVSGEGVVFQNGEMRVGELYYASKDTPSTPLTSVNDKTCSYIVYVKQATNFTVNNLTTYGGINVSASTATINNLSFSGTKFYAVCSQSSATVTLNGGTYTKAITGATGNLFWIETGSVMNITGGTYIKGNASFRSGVNPVITGGVFDFNPTNFGVKEGYVATETGTGTWTVGPMPAITVGTGGDYATLAEAVAAVNDGGTIQLVSDIDVSSSISLPRSLILDLNGYTITSSAILFNIYNNYDLTIKDSGENGAINVAGAKIVHCSSSSSKIKIEGGNLSAYSSNWQGTIGINITSGASVEMTGGKITITNAAASKGSCIYNSGNGSVTVSGGELLANAQKENYPLWVTGSGNTTISGGVITGMYGLSGYSRTYPHTVYNTGTGTVSISGGYIKAIGGDSNWGNGGYLVYGNASITGGYFYGYYVNDSIPSQIVTGYQARELTSSESDVTDAAAYAAGYQYVVEAQ